MLYCLKMVARNQQLTRQWFERHHEDYDVLIVQAQRGLYENAGPALSRHVLGRTLVVGSGPLLNFAAGAAATLRYTLWHGNGTDIAGAGAISHTHPVTGAPAFRPNATISLRFAWKCS